MISRRLTAAVIAQLVAGAALVTPGVAHWQPGDCEGPLNRTCDTSPEHIWWGPDDYTVIVDGYECDAEGSPHFDEYWAQDTDEDGLDDVDHDLMEQCEEWIDGGPGGGFQT